MTALVFEMIARGERAVERAKQHAPKALETNDLIDVLGGQAGVCMHRADTNTRKKNY